MTAQPPTGPPPGLGPFPDFVEVRYGSSTGPAPGLHDFDLAAVPTTVGQYWRYLVEAQLTGRPAARLHGFPPVAGTGLWTTPSGGVAVEQHLNQLPVTSVTWHGAVAYCRWLSQRTGARCRLPTAAEWYCAAAGPAGRRWALGDEFDRAIYAPPASAPRPVGGTPANPYGLYDLTGNVFEWCADPLTSPANARDRPRAPIRSRVIKGGAYTVRNPESFANATVFTADESSAVPYIGFRVLRERPAG